MSIAGKVVLVSHVQSAIHLPINEDGFLEALRGNGKAWTINLAHFEGGNTPLGNALNAAAQAVLSSPLPRKHVLVITDGISNTGPPPAAVMPRLKQQAEKQNSEVSVHFVAFDVDAKVFDPVKKLGVTVVGAANEQQLNSQLEFILKKKILLEEEEPAKK